MSRFHDVLAQNPYRFARERMDMTQKLLADLSGVSIQYIYRNENGLVNTPSMQLAQILEVPEYIMEQDFYAWVKDMRKLVGEAYGSMGWHGGYMYSDDTNPAEAFSFGIAACFAIKFDPTAEISTQFFCRIMCLHPRTVQQFLKNKGELSPTFKYALADTGIPGLAILELEDECRRYATR